MSDGYGLLNGEKVYLRPLNGEDAELYYAMFYDGETRRLTGTKRHITKEGIAEYISRKSEDDSSVLLLIALRESDEVIGDIAIQDIDRTNRSANMRIAIGNSGHRNRGYGREAMLLLLDYAFGLLNLHRMELEVYSYNAHARHVYESLGFVQEGLRREALYYDHEYHDVIQMSLLEEEFRAKHRQVRSEKVK